MITLSVGWLRIRSVRDYLDTAQFVGFRVHYIETGPFFARLFHIKGESASQVVDQMLKDVGSGLDVAGGTPAT